MASSRVTHGPAVLEARERIPLKQQEVAERVGISASYLSRIESGIEQPGMGTQTVHKLAEVLGVSIDDITVPAVTEVAS